MKKLIATAALLLPALAAVAENVHVTTGGTSLVLDATRGAAPQILYYGAGLAPADVEGLAASEAPLRAYPAYGLNCQGETAISVTHPDGDMTLDLRLEEVTTSRADGLTVTTLRMRDAVYPVEVSLNYRPYPGTEVIETWVEITNSGKKPLTLDRYYSAYLPVRRGDVWLSSLYGSWANEGQLLQEPLTPGVKTIKNKDGVRNSHTAHGEVMFSLDGRPDELHGNTIGAALCYSGNYELKIDTDDSEFHHFFAGINPDNSAYRLARGETFVTPPLALTFSPDGTSGVSRNFHRWGRKYKLAHGDRPRKILLNSWEGVYFDIKEPEMHQMMDDIASMGGELFVMDDGWFGTKYPRNNDSSSLGDWTTDASKLPAGTADLVKQARDRGIGFGIWIEPEMTNTVSELYEKHPDWIVRPASREPQTGRGGTQLVLDLSNPEVQDFVFGVFDRVMQENPGLEYIKWDANMGIQNHGSTYLTADRQSHLYIDWHRGFENVCRRIRGKYPDVTVQACASGGGRANWGVLPYFDEFWVSDNTDALQRVYMQWGTSYFFPAIAMASHISNAPNHQTFRTIPLKYRIDVAMSGRLGMEIQPKNMTGEEKAQCRKAIAEYKEIRPVVQQGDLYRLQSPYDGKGVASLMYVAESGDEAVFYWYKTETFVNQHLPRVKMAGLDPAKSYRVTELDRIDNTPLPFEGKSFTGAYLMANGLEIPYTHDVDYHKKNDYASRVLRLQAVAGGADSGLSAGQSTGQLRQRLQRVAAAGRTVFGHHDDPVYGHGWSYLPGGSDVKAVTGQYPGMMSWDLGGIETGDSRNLDAVPFDSIRTEAIAQHLRGGINTFSWHPVENPASGGGSWDCSDSTVVRRMVADPEVNARYRRQVRALAGFFNSLTLPSGGKVPVIFRPWHEHTGSWFWWGAPYRTEADYRALWHIMREEMDAAGVDNILWAYSPDRVSTSERYLEGYPGDEYVDILGGDVYAFNGRDGIEPFRADLRAELAVITGEARRRGKIAALTETGLEGLTVPDWLTSVLLPVVKEYPVSYLVVWRNAWDKPGHFFVPYPGFAGEESLRDFEADPATLFINDLKKY